MAVQGDRARGISAERFEIPLAGGVAASMAASGPWLAGSVRGVGGTRPPRLAPEGKRERGNQIPCAAGFFGPTPKLMTQCQRIKVSK